MVFQIREGTSKLTPERQKLYHRFTAKLLYASKRVRGDISYAVAFLTTRVQNPNEDDWNKLTRVVGYLKSTLDMCLALEADNANIIKWWVDAAYAVHVDCRSHTGATMTLGKGAVYNTSTKQKLNTKSSTEAELIAVDDVSGQVLWTKYFLESQGYRCTESIIYQDNKSVMLMETKGKVSTTKRTKHINVRYFFH